jgi:hypothetical protein
MLEANEPELDSVAMMKIKIIALESVLDNVLAPIIRTLPHISSLVIKGIRHELIVNAHEQQKLACEEYLNQVVDRLEAKVKAAR